MIKLNLLIPNTPTKEDSGADIQRRSGEKNGTMKMKTYTTNMHMITWVLVRVERTGVKTRFKVELVESRCLNVD